MIFDDAGIRTIEQNVVKVFTDAGIFDDMIPPLPLSLSIHSQNLKKDWEQQWKPGNNGYYEGTLIRSWNWGIESFKRTHFGWYAGEDLFVQGHLRIIGPDNNPKFKTSGVAICLIERKQTSEFIWSKGLTRPLFYETARQIGLLTNTPNMFVLGAYMANDQDDFDLFFEMQSDDPENTPLKDCTKRTRECSIPFDWSSLPIYFEMKAERKSVVSAPTPSI